MKIIVDSGSTKAHWLIYDQHKEGHKIFTSLGMNPYHNSDENLQNILNTLKINDSTSKNVSDLYFYGSGCSQKDQIARIYKVLLEKFPKSKISIASDMLGAGRAGLGMDTGIVAILGTGSNAAFMEKGQMKQGILSYGYILGDEGSGSYLGKKILQAYLHGELSQIAECWIKSHYDVSRQNILQQLYQEQQPNRFLAQFAPVASSFPQDEKLQEIVLESFRKFFNYYISKFDFQDKFAAIGSIAFHFQDQLRMVSQEHHFKQIQVLASPIEALYRFHKNYEL